MKEELKKSFIISGVAIIIAAAITLFVDNGSRAFLETFITTLFYIGLPIALIGVAMYVGKSGFFDFFAFSLRR